MLVDGKWGGKWQPIQQQDKAGRFIRQASSIRNWITVDGRPGPTGKGDFPAESERYLLYVSLLCPWASRALLARKLKNLERLVQVVIVSPVLGDQGWEFGCFPGASKDPLFNSNYLHQIYTRHDPSFTGRATVPVLWDRKQNTMVSNESADILRMFNSVFCKFTTAGPDLYPLQLQKEIDAWNDLLYRDLNNGVYQAGFASSQTAYNEAVENIFALLGRLEKQLAGTGSYLLGHSMTETDIRLFVTLIRFDLVYHGLFKCNLKRIADFPYLSRYLGRIYNLPGVAQTVDFDHIKAGYYSIRTLNPSGIVPQGPILNLTTKKETDHETLLQSGSLLPLSTHRRTRSRITS